MSTSGIVNSNWVDNQQKVLAAATEKEQSVTEQNEGATGCVCVPTPTCLGKLQWQRALQRRLGDLVCRNSFLFSSFITYHVFMSCAMHCG